MKIHLCNYNDSNNTKDKIWYSMGEPIQNFEKKS